MQKLGERIGVGRTAEVFRLGEEQVVKLLLPGFPDELGRREAEIGELMNVAVSTAPRFVETTRLNGRLGLVYALVSGPTMLDELVARPWSLSRFADEFATLHAAMHAVDGTGLPNHRDTMQYMVGEAAAIAGDGAGAAAQRRVEELPDGTAICHGDMHPGNVIRAQGGSVVIDWMTARAGPPEADVARTLHLLLGSAVPVSIPRLRRWLIGSVRRAFTERYMRTYRRLRPVDPALVLAWRLPVLVARMAEGIAEEAAGLRSAIAHELERAEA